jgi:hypothetical protein
MEIFKRVKATAPKGVNKATGKPKKVRLTAHHVFSIKARHLQNVVAKTNT